VGFLGAEAPAVKGLKRPSVAFAEHEDGVIEFSDWTVGTTAGLFRSLRDWLIGQFGTEQADKALPSWSVQSLADEAVRAATPTTEPQAAGLSYSERKDVTTPTKEELDAQAAQIKKDREAIDRDRAQVDEQRRATAHAARVAEFNDFTGGLVKAGQLLPVHQAGLVAVMAGLPDAQVVEFSEGEKTVNKPALEVLKSFLQALPKVVDFTERAGGFTKRADDDDGAQLGEVAEGVSIAKAAVEFQDAEEKAGRTVSLEAAVQHVSNQRKG
jgi:hypothetical protein